MATTDLKANVPVTVSLDIEELVQAYVGTIPTYTGDPDDDVEAPPPLYGEIITAAAHVVARSVINDTTRYGGLKRYVEDAITRQLDTLVAAELEKPFKPVDTYGEVIRGAEPTSLREQIGQHATTWIAKAMKSGSRYASDNGELYKYIDGELLKLLKTDLKAAADQARAAVTTKIQTEAAKVLGDIITQAGGVK